MLNERIKERREVLGLTLADLAKKIGATEAITRKYESGEIESIKSETVIKLAEALKCTPVFLMGWENGPSEYAAEQQSANKNIDTLVKVAKNLSEDDLDMLLATANRMIKTTE